MNSDRSKSIDDVRSAQQNTLVPHILKNDSRINDVLWHGSQDALGVQRIGLLVIGSVLIFCGLSIALTANQQHYVFEVAIAVLFVGAGCRVAMNGLRKSKKRKPQDNTA
jgi:hypothetical protein